MTQQEALQENINRLIDDWCTEDREDVSTIKLTNTITRFINEYVTEVVGEDEEENREKDYMTYENSQKNILRAEQRKRAGI